MPDDARKAFEQAMKGLDDPLGFRSAIDAGLRSDQNYLRDHFELQEAIRKQQARRDSDARDVADAARSTLQAAENCVAHIISELNQFQNLLDDQTELALLMIDGPASPIMYPRQIEFDGADRVVFRGDDEAGLPFVAVQHVNRVNFWLRAFKVAVGEEPRRFMGFHSPDPSPQE